MVVKAIRVAQPVDSFPHARASNESPGVVGQQMPSARPRAVPGRVKVTKESASEVFAMRPTIVSDYIYATGSPFADDIALSMATFTVSLGRDRTYGANSTGVVRRLINSLEFGLPYSL